MHSQKVYRVRILDVKYLQDYDHLNFQYLTYEVKAKYMKGLEPMSSEELPFLIKLFSVDKNI